METRACEVCGKTEPAQMKMPMWMLGCQECGCAHVLCFACESMGMNPEMPKKYIADDQIIGFWRHCPTKAKWVGLALMSWEERLKLEL